MLSFSGEKNNLILLQIYMPKSSFFVIYNTSTKKKKMEGNFYVSSSSVTVESKGKLAQAFLGCHEESELYGKCVEKAHANKELKLNSCKEERLNLRKCIDAGVLKSRGEEFAAKYNEKMASMDSVVVTATTETATTKE
jgi:hypothetical protein